MGFSALMMRGETTLHDLKSSAYRRARVRASSASTSNSRAISSSLSRTFEVYCSSGKVVTALRVPKKVLGQLTEQVPIVLAVFCHGEPPNSYRLSQEPYRSPQSAHRFLSAIRLAARDFAGVAPWLFRRAAFVDAGLDCPPLAGAAETSIRRSRARP
jgi:hypothetical protein